MFIAQFPNVIFPCDGAITFCCSPMYFAVSAPTKDLFGILKALNLLAVYKSQLGMISCV